MVSQLTNYPAFALSSGGGRVTIRRFDLLMVEHNAFIIVVMTDTNIVRNRLVRLPSGNGRGRCRRTGNSSKAGPGPNCGIRAAPAGGRCRRCVRCAVDYAKITARLSYLAEGLSRLFGRGALPEDGENER